MEATQNNGTNTSCYKAQFYTDFDPAIPLPGIYSKEIVTDIHKYLTDNKKEKLNS